MAAEKIYSCPYDLKCFTHNTASSDGKHPSFQQKRLKNAEKSTFSVSSYLLYSSRRSPGRDILSLCDERSLSIPITEFNHIGTILQICLQLCSTALMFPYKADPGSFTAYFDPAFFRER